jgi:hypothetical protein
MDDRFSAAFLTMKPHPPEFITILNKGCPEILRAKVRPKIGP